MKVIFDRSAFHRERFDLLERSPLSQLVQDRKVFVFHTTVFLEETLRMMRSRKQNVQAEFKRQWPFLRSICNGGWFKPLLFGEPGKLTSVCEEELEGGERDIYWPLVPLSARSRTEAQLSECIEESGPLLELHNAIPVWDESEHKKKANKAELNDLRKRRLLRTGENFEEYYQSQADHSAWHLIYRTLAFDQPQVKLDAWRDGPQRFPHFTAYLRASIYGLYYAEDQNLPLDSNWLEDIEQLCFLEDVDIIVSCDSKFMRKAFEQLWYPKEKRMLTPAEFVKTLA